MSTKRREKARRLRNGDGVVVCSCGCGRIPPPPRSTWFSAECVEQWRIKNDPGYVRGKILERDRGICALCHTDTLAFKARIETHLHEPRRYWRWWVSKRAAALIPQHTSWGSALHAAEREMDGWRKEIEAAWAAHSAWQADHILPVCEGGGQCGLENYRTLCTACHKQVTAALAARRAAQARCARLPPDLFSWQGPL